VGDNPLNFADWLFLEPQTDQFIEPGDWDMPFGTNVQVAVEQVVTAGVEFPDYLLTFSVAQTGGSLVSGAVGLVRARQAAAAAGPENLPNAWSPRVLATGSGLLLFDRTRDDLSRVTDLHVAGLATAGSGPAVPLTGSPQFSRNLDAMRAPDGRFHVLWYGNQNDAPGLFYGLLDPVTQKLSGITRLESAVHLPREARVATTSGGGLHVFWLEDQGNMMLSLPSGIYWTEKTAGGWSQPQRLVPLPYENDYPYTGNREAKRYWFDVGSRPDGTLVLVWLDHDPAYQSLTLKEIDYNGAWSQPSLVDTANSPELAQGSGGLSLRSDSKGILHLAYWLDPTNDITPNYPALKAVLYYRTLGANGWSAASRVDSQAAGQCPHLIAFEDSVLLVWERHTAQGVSIVWSMFEGNAWNAPQVLPVTPGTDPFYPTGDVLGDGRVALVWSERSADRIGVGFAYLPSQPERRDRDCDTKSQGHCRAAIRSWPAARSGP